MKGRILGLELAVEEVVREREAPSRKVWETIGQPTLLVIEWYRMGFTLTPQGAGSQLHVFIDYTVPRSGSLYPLARLLAPAYARWCVRRIVRDAEQTFVRSPTG